MKKCIKVLCLTLVLTLIVGLFSRIPVQAAAKAMKTCAHKPGVAAPRNGAFTASATVEVTQNFDIQGWVAADSTVTDFYWKFVYNNTTYKGNLTKTTRNDVAAVYPGYKTYAGYVINNNYRPKLPSTPGGTKINLEIRAKVNNKDTLIGTYNLSVKATEPRYSCADLPAVAAPKAGAFNVDAFVNPAQNLDIQGWIVSNTAVKKFYWEYTYGNKTYKGSLYSSTRDDVKKSLSWL